MREIYQYTHPNISATNYVKQRLLNSDVDRSLANANGYGLKEWFYNRQDRCSIRYTITVHWTEPIKHIFGADELTITEKRTFQLDKIPIMVKSTINTNFHYISATVSHTFQDRNGGCLEEQTIEVNYSGGTFKDQIELDFFNAVSPLILSNSTTRGIIEVNNSNNRTNHPNIQKNNGNNVNSTKTLAVPPQNFQTYHLMHDKLEELKESSLFFSQVIKKSKISRTPLTLPSADQIARITEIVEPDNFSIHDEITQMKAESNRTLRIVGEIKRVRQQTASSSSLPLFVLASCAAIVALVVSRT